MNEWSTGLCQCCSSNSCCATCFCPCVVFGEITEKMSPDETCFGGDQQGACCCYFLLVALFQWAGFVDWFGTATFVFPCTLCLRCPLRRAIRKKYNIEGSDCNDCMVSWCCSCCSLVQEYEEVRRRQPSTMNSMYEEDEQWESWS